MQKSFISYLKTTLHTQLLAWHTNIAHTAISTTLLNCSKSFDKVWQSNMFIMKGEADCETLCDSSNDSLYDTASIKIFDLHVSEI